MNARERVGQHFELAEVAHSPAASKRGIDQLALITPTVKANARRLATEILDKVRGHFGKPVLVSSWYRSPVVNKAVGGAATSQHLTGQAADINVHGVSVDDVFNWIAFESGIKFDQVIHEFGSWVHVSISAKPRGERLKAYRKGNRTVYETVTKPVDS
jgi:hypothetical protein